MITGNVEKVIEWLKLNNIVHWSLHNNANTQANNKIFESYDDCNIEDEFERMRRVVGLSQNPTIYINAKQNLSKQVNNYQETWRNMPDNTGVTGVAPSATIGAAELANMGYLTPEEADKRIAAALEAERFRREKEDFEKAIKEFKAEKKEFDNFKHSAIGALLEKGLPYLGAMFGVEPKADAYRRVAGTSGPTVANTIQAQNPDAEEPEEEPIDKENDNAPTPPVQTVPVAEEPEVFGEEESDRLFELMKRFKEFDPDYLSVVEKIVNIATSGQEVCVGGMLKFNYEQLKEMILKL